LPDTEINLVRIQDSTRETGEYHVYNQNPHTRKIPRPVQRAHRRWFRYPQETGTIMLFIATPFLTIILLPEITTTQSKKNSPHSDLQLQYERFALRGELDRNLSKPPLQLVNVIRFSAFMAPNGELNDSRP
jgi:hypothetical protein